MALATGTCMLDVPGLDTAGSANHPVALCTHVDMMESKSCISRYSGRAEGLLNLDFTLFNKCLI